MKLDHLVICGETLEEAIDFAESSIGVKLQNGGKHKYYGTHNALLKIGEDTYLEAIAIDPNVSDITIPRWFNLNNFSGKPRLKNWVCQCKDLNAELKYIPSHEYKLIELNRDQFNWLMTVPEDGLLLFNEAFPSLIEWKSYQTPPAFLKESFCELNCLTITHPKASQIKRILKNFNDPRVNFEESQSIEFYADFKTPHGKRSIHSKNF